MGAQVQEPRERIVEKEESKKGRKIHLRVAHRFSCIASEHEGARKIIEVPGEE